MIILEPLLNLYISLIFGTTSIIEALTGLYPREQSVYVQQLQDLLDIAEFAPYLLKRL
ncbi:hypothetical protein clg_14 [Corynebacterium phage CL31]|nr:hypothetical protein clg_14 [Corynebacterium phage CL31]